MYAIAEKYWRDKEEALWPKLGIDLNGELN
jgi:hypothetical protein